MSEIKGQVIPIAIEDEVKESYLNYAMSVIVSRALPDVRDGMKPVHRRILYSMSEMGLRHDRPYKKCGRIVGDVLGKFHPHGDQSIYDALVRLAQNFSLRRTLVQGQGNFGSVDGDPPAAMRYTEARLARISESMLRDINKETVTFVPNYDESMMEPSILPAALPNLLLNGSSGIAVGMATNMSPHNLGEVCQAICAFIDDPEISIDSLMQIITGPDFPTAAIVHGRSGFRLACHTGRGKIVVRAKYHLEPGRGDKESIIFTELPYQVNKAMLIIHIAELVREKKIEGIADLRDESDRVGTRVVIELKKGSIPKVVLNNLFAHTKLQINFNVNNLALVDGRPRLLNLKDLIQEFVKHRKIIITRRSEFELKKSKARAHILEGIKKALENIDEIVEIIKKSNSVETAQNNLIARFDFSEKQAKAILDLRLQKLTSLETQKILDELEEIRKTILYLEDLLAHEEKILGVIQEETTELSNQYSTERLTVISREEVVETNIEDFIVQEDMVVVISNRGYVKRVALSEYRTQGRGGKGAKTTQLKDNDFIEHVFLASTHSYILFVTSKGKAYCIKVFELPEASKTSLGRHLKTIFEFQEDEEITAMVPLKEFSEETSLFMATHQGVVKRVATSDFRNTRMRGIIAINLDEGDHLVKAVLISGNQDIFLVTQMGKGLRFADKHVRQMGRNSRGVRGIRLAKGDSVIGVCPVSQNQTMLIVSEKGYGKRTDFDQFSSHGRGTGGQRAYKCNERTGKLVAAIAVGMDDNCIGITQLGKALRFSVSQVSQMGRTAFGVRVLNMGRDDSLIGIARQPNEEESDDDSMDKSAEVQLAGSTDEEQKSVELDTTDQKIEKTHDDGLEIY